LTTIRKPDLIVLFFIAIQKPENSTLGHKSTIQKPDLWGFGMVTVFIFCLKECETSAGRKNNDSTSELSEDNVDFSTPDDALDDLSSGDEDEDDFTVLERGKRIATSIGKGFDFAGNKIPLL
jgi:hypothetical protein